MAPAGRARLDAGHLGRGAVHARCLGTRRLEGASPLVVSGVAIANTKFNDVSAKLDKGNERLTSMDGKLDAIVDLLRDIRDRLGSPTP